MDRLNAHFAPHLRARRLWYGAIWLRSHGLTPLARWMLRRLRCRYGADLPLWSVRPKELYLMHNALGVVIHPDTTLTGPTILFHQVTLGNGWVEEAREGAPTLGRYVFVGAGARILGKVVIGDHVVIGANCVVTQDIPSNSLVSLRGVRTIGSAVVKARYFAVGRV